MFTLVPDAPNSLAVSSSGLTIKLVFSLGLFDLTQMLENVEPRD